MRNIILWIVLAATVRAEHHMNRRIESRQNNNSSGLQIVISNMCADKIWPGVVTQSSTGPTASGFELDSGANRTINVANDWQGRVWGRTNCSFSSDGSSQGSCTTGECGALNCRQAGNPPATLAEFTMDGGSDQTFYDLSLVDGYNLPMAIVLIPNDVEALKDIQAKHTNPSCVGSVGNLAPQSFNPYANSQQFLGTTSSSPMDFDKSVSLNDVADWCPWDLQTLPPSKPGNGVYPYPDSNIQRPAFAPCISACKKYNKAKYCCTGKYGPVGSCQRDYYGDAAKKVCPDAYSFAQDDQSSTFIVPKGASYQVIFCPGGRSTNIIANNDKAGGTTSKASVGKKSALMAGGSLIGGIAWGGVVWAGFWVAMFVTCGVGG
ncbi:unnamed protein product [Zymoseptoria tritici ST99CH_3D1]|uniref:Osmotin, thaumatin-like protein n=2 Tax=Zymoseptoria tritici TaxID=1047171 RepID=A0A2H1FYP3_ZYMTR|nr:unnamed protein product [Zymoseptoria tritici ST99CH_1E4]SMR47679.1 unnamed protein product [Zymoseptoria tritici ST99CH_3D1]